MTIEGKESNAQANATQSANEHSQPFGDTRWLVAFRLTRDTARRKTSNIESVGDPRVAALISSTAPYHGMVSVDDGGRAMTVSMRSTGHMDDALSDSKAVLLACLRKADVRGWRIEAARMAETGSVLEVADLGGSVRLLSVTEVAKALGVSKQRVSKMLQTGKLPEPDAMVGSAPGWLPTKVEAVLARRDRQGELVDLP